MKPDIIVQLAANPDELAMKLVRLKQIFPQADTVQMVCSQLSLVLSADLDSIAASAEQLREILPNVNVDRWDAYTYQLLLSLQASDPQCKPA